MVCATLRNECLYEAIRDKQRAFAAKASAISVALDERKGHLLVTFRACAGLEVCHGILADMQEPGKSAVQIACVEGIWYHSKKGHVRNLSFSDLRGTPA